MTPSKSARRPTAAPHKERGLSRWHQLTGAAIFVVAVLCYVNAATNGFTLDDLRLIVENDAIRTPHAWRNVFTTTYWPQGAGVLGLNDAGLYRPLTSLSFVLDWAAWANDAVPYHVENILLHGVVSILVFETASGLLASEVCAAIGALIFAVHPIHTEAVASIVGRGELLAALFALVALLAARRARSAEGALSVWLVPVVACYAAAMLCKESAIVLPALIALDEWVVSQRRSVNEWRRSLPLYSAFAFAAVAFLLVRQQIVGQHLVWSGFVGVSAVSRVMTASRVLMEYLGLFLFPLTLRADYWVNDVPIATVTDLWFWCSIGLWAALYIVARRSRIEAFRSGLVWFFVAVLPASNLLFASGIGKAERILYLPSVGLCFAAAALLERIPIRARRMSLAAAAAAMLIFAGRTLRRNADWRDNLTLGLATLASSPNSPLMNDLVGREFAARHDFQRAVGYYQNALRSAPGAPIVESHLGVALLSTGDVQGAVDALSTAVRSAPENADLHGNLALAYMRANRSEDAIRELTESSRLEPSSAKPHINLGILQSSAGRLDLAEQELHQAIQLDPASFEARVDLGFVYLKANRLEDAITVLLDAVRLNPTSVQAHNNLGTAYLRHGQRTDAKREYETALSIDPSYASARASLQMLNAGGSKIAPR